MRNKNKVYCDCCGTFLRELDKKEMNMVNQMRKNGMRFNCGYVCNDCAFKNDKRLSSKQETAQ